MKKTLLLIVGFLVSFLISGCATNPSVPEIRYKTKVVAPEDNLIVDCDIEPPMVVKDYVAIPNYVSKEGVLVDLNEKNMVNLQKCNERWKALREWKAKQLQIYKDEKP